MALKIKVYNNLELSNLKSGQYFPIDVENTYLCWGGTDPKKVQIAVKFSDVMNKLLEKGIFAGAGKVGAVKSEKPKKGILGRKK